MYHYVLPGTKDVSDISCRKNLNTYFVSKTFSRNREVYDITTKITAQPTCDNKT
jgi:hypothetical protein